MTATKECSVHSVNCKLFTSRICPLALGGALAIFWGVSLFIKGMIIHYCINNQVPMQGLSLVYESYLTHVGHTKTISAHLIGSLIGACKGFLAGVVIAWLYNMFTCCSRKNKHSECD